LVDGSEQEIYYDSSPAFRVVPSWVKNILPISIFKS
jgi:hypothetical protein